jgi:enamine deaminase RidA (YjgF/YER057c/UK114 family)
MSMDRKHVSTGSPFEASIGFSRAVRVGNIIAIAGTAPIGADGETACPGDVQGQARRCFDVILAAVREAGGMPSDIVRTRIFLTRIEDWPLVAKVHGEVFGNIRPACTVMQVTRFIDPRWLVEIEADAVRSSV